MQRLRRNVLARHPILWPRTSVLIEKAIPEPILDGLNPDRAKRWKPIYLRRPRDDTVEATNFSFVDDPINTISILKKIAV